MYIFLLNLILFYFYSIFLDAGTKHISLCIVLCIIVYVTNNKELRIENWVLPARRSVVNGLLILFSLWCTFSSNTIIQSARNERDINLVIHLTRHYSNDLGMPLGLDKCGRMILKGGKVISNTSNSSLFDWSLKNQRRFFPKCGRRTQTDRKRWRSLFPGV